MVIVKLMGGLANQMFPYAAGRRLAHVLGTELKLDISSFAENIKQNVLVQRQFGLRAFNIVECLATPEEVAKLRQAEPDFLDRLLGRKPKAPSTYIRERYFHFDPRILSLRGDVYLEGNWNSERYFADSADIIRQDFTFKKLPVGRNLELLDIISATESVSIHVRRGDYAADPKISQIYGTCGPEYYRAAVDWILRKTSHPHFFVFSDEPQWVRENFPLDLPHTIVDHNGTLDGHEDLRLMSNCQHNIIANSGFSWWAAWLNGNSEKQIVAPKRWFQTAKHDVRDLIPAGWICL